jgi:cytochrome c2
MAASDAFYRKQNALDVVFGVSSVLMLVSLIWMFVQDYNREFKAEQRTFRDVESALAQRMALNQIPSGDELTEAEAKVAAARKEREENDAAVQKLRSQIAELQPKKERLDVRFQEIKSEIESRMSFYDLETERTGPSSPLATRYLSEVAEYQQQLNGVAAERDAIVARISDLRREVDGYEKGLTDAISNLKKVNDRFDTQVKLAINKRWGFGDWLRNQPIIDGFAAPVKIHQITNNDIPIDYNFKHVTRFDRCQTCHLGIDRPAYTKENLRALTEITEEQESKLEQARGVLRSRREALEGLPEQSQVPDPDQLVLTKLSESQLSPTRIAEYAAHPRLDLFVGADSKHPVEWFGCSSCHSGQGSATSFTLASHTPNTAPEKERWKKQHDWESIHMWDFPMLPKRFTEASCLKCHHQVTDLISANGRNEAPKVLRGYNLIKEFGCFGCHEIAGRKGGRDIGPDLRLEPNVPLDELTPGERVKAESDPDNPPGHMRKVGPSLYRISEKTHPEWMVKWLRSPRGFRPDTKMPHFYGVSNNHPDVLPEEQKEFPDTEMWAITHYLFGASDGYLKQVAKHQKDAPEAREKDETRRIVLLAKSKLTAEETTELAAIQERMRLRSVKPLVDPAPNHKADAANGRKLFVERGCLACHSHPATGKGDKGAPSILSDADFGPNLGQLVEKLGKKQSARMWLTQWILDPHVHSPRSRMPVTHLEPVQAADVAEWLLSQPALDLGSEWKDIAVKEPTDKDLKELAKVYFTRLLSKSDMTKLIDAGEKLPETVIKDLPVDEQALANDYNMASLKHYLGKKAVGRQGCYACHDIPGFENAKPIGVALNDWGKKMPDRLAYEDIVNFVHDKYQVVESLVDENGKPNAHVEDGKLPVEKYFTDQLVHHGRTREGFLHQKLLHPRSYDYNRVRAWDDRLRMPEFRFARIDRKPDESDEDFEARQIKEEADAREAVMTFVLGLVAEPVPLKSVNRPTGDRLAQVKGRQVLDKYNCGGCHLIAPGVFDFKASPEATQVLANQARTLPSDHVFLNHRNWVGPLPKHPDRLTAKGVVVPKIPSDDDEEEEELSKFSFRLTDALRFYTEDKKIDDVPTFAYLSLPVEDMIDPAPEVAKSKEAVQRYLEDQGQYGGAFADLLVYYLHKLNKKDYPRGPDGDSARARLHVPPLLIGQGEKTQPEWLYEFLLNPYRVRKMTLLQMPRFNMSKDEAQTLVDYFSGVERMSNPGIGLTYPYEMIKQQDPVNDEYWRARTATHVATMKATKAPGEGGKTVYDQRVAELQPVWQRVLKDYEAAHAQAKKNLEVAEERLKKARAAEEAATAELAKLTQQLGETKDDAALKKLQAEKAAAEDKVKTLKDTSADEDKIKSAWESEASKYAELVAANSVAQQQERWTVSEAYVTDAFRLVFNKQLCIQCHEVGSYAPKNDILGPPLTNSHKRLRPGWTERWIANPQRFLTYTTSMPVNFPADKKDQFGEFYAGTPLERVEAIRDMLMIYPQASSLPVNRYWALPPPELTGGAKTEKGVNPKGANQGAKTGEKK